MPDDNEWIVTESPLSEPGSFVLTLPFGHCSCCNPEFCPDCPVCPFCEALSAGTEHAPELHIGEERVL